jgi:hypothetical protein
VSGSKGRSADIGATSSSSSNVVVPAAAAAEEEVGGSTAPVYSGKRPSSEVENEEELWRLDRWLLDGDEKEEVHSMEKRAALLAGGSGVSPYKNGMHNFVAISAVSEIFFNFSLKWCHCVRLTITKRDIFSKKKCLSQNKVAFSRLYNILTNN